MGDDIKDIEAWITQQNCYFVMGQPRLHGLLTDEEIRAAMRMSRHEWVNLMRSKFGLEPIPYPEIDKEKKE